MNSQEHATFKACPGCSAQWRSRSGMLTDPNIRLLGYQKGAEGHKPGLFLFMHLSCGSILALDIPDVEDLAQLPKWSRADCSFGVQSAFCLAAPMAKQCPRECICLFVWNVKRTLETWPKRWS